MTKTKKKLWRLSYVWSLLSSLFDRGKWVGPALASGFLYFAKSEYAHLILLILHMSLTTNFLPLHVPFAAQIR